MKTLFHAAGAAMLVLSLSCCKKNNDAPANSASVMFVNGCAGTTSVTATAAGAAVPGTTNLAFPKSSGYQYVAAGSAVALAFSANANGVSVPLSNATESLTANAHYTAFAGGFITSPSFVFAQDDITAVSGMAKIRFVNLSPDTLTENVYIGLSTKVDSNVSYKTVTPFITVSPVTGATIYMQAPTSGVAITDQVSGVTLNAGKVYTVVLTGSLSGNGASQRTLTVINNN